MVDILDEEVEDVRIRVAERLGWRTLEYNRDSLLVGRPAGKKVISHVPSYPRDIKAAWEVIEFATSRNVRFSLVNEALRGHIRNYMAQFGDKSEPLGAASNRIAPLAICLAF